MLVCVSGVFICKITNEDNELRHFLVRIDVIIYAILNHTVDADVERF